MNEFKTYHPVVNLIYFVFVIGFSCFFMHPVCLVISFFCSFLYSVLLKGRRAVKINLLYMLPTIVFMALINPVFNHRGATVICYLPDGNPLTAESVIYGISTALMIASVICFFFCYSEVMTSDKFIYLFGKIIPSISLIVSMTFRLVPDFITKFREVAYAQKCMGRDVWDGSLINRAKNALAVISVMVTRTLENSVETADSMKARGYGISGRTSFSIYKFDKRDTGVLVCIGLFGVYVFSGAMMGAMDFSYFPYLKSADTSFFTISVFVAYFLLCLSPVIIELVEVRRWKALRSKI